MLSSFQPTVLPYGSPQNSFAPDLCLDASFNISYAQSLVWTDTVDHFDHQVASYQAYLNGLDSLTRYGEDGEQAKYDRWHHFWRKKVDSDGSLTSYWRRTDPTVVPNNQTNTPSCDFGGDWIQLGPMGMPCEDNASGGGSYPTGVGRFNKVILDPNFAQNGIVYATAHGGSLYKSTDRGRQWSDMTMGKIHRGGSFDLAINPLRNNTIYLATGSGDESVNVPAATNSAGLFVSYDGGES